MAVARLLATPASFCTIVIIILFLIISMPGRTNAMSQSDALLRLKSSFTDAISLASWSDSTDPCAGSWIGVVCFNGIVTGLHLGGMNLAGKIDVDALLDIRGLRTISFVNNMFSGSIPEFNRMGALKAIYISGNQFSGEISADYFENMGSLKKLWLSDNQFSGNIPSSISQLSHLIELHLENNQFSGEIPSINVPTLKSFSASNNKLQGEIPPSLSKFDKSSFAENAGLCGEKLGQECPKETNPSSPTDSGRTSIAKIIIITVVVLILLLIIAVFLILGRKRSEKAEDAYYEEPSKQSTDEQPPVEIALSVPSKKEETEVPRKSSLKNLSRKGSNSTRGSGSIDLVLLNREKGIFGMSDLMKASAEVLGNGGLGSSYKAVVSHKLTVVVKRIREMNGMGKEEFDIEVRKLGKLRHPNILTPLAYHFRRDEKLLVSELIPKGSLLYLLHGDRGPSHATLDWSVRLKIIKGISRGLDHMHDELAWSDLPHGNLKSSNILIGPDDEPLLADYGFKHLLNSPIALQTLFAYKIPEAAHYGIVSPKSDVYCLGIVIFEILTGKFPSQYLHNGKGGTDVVEWVISAISEGREAEMFDPEIMNLGSSTAQLEKLLHIGAACTETNPELRLDLKEATRRIDEILIELNGDARVIQVPSLRDRFADSYTEPTANRSTKPPGDHLHEPSGR